MLTRLHQALKQDKDSHPAKSAMSQAIGYARGAMAKTHHLRRARPDQHFLDNRISAGRKLAVGTRPVANRLASALRMAARSLYRTESVLGDWFRRLRAKLGTAAAHKLARVLYAMIKHSRPFDPTRLGNPTLRRQRKENALRRAAKELGFGLQPSQPAVAVS